MKSQNLLSSLTLPSLPPPLMFFFHFFLSSMHLLHFSISASSSCSSHFSSSYSAHSIAPLPSAPPVCTPSLLLPVALNSTPPTATTHHPHTHLPAASIYPIPLPLIPLYMGVNPVKVGGATLKLLEWGFGGSRASIMYRHVR